jgi:hypothetical protein
LASRPLQGGPPPRVDASEEARAYIRERGGAAYVWLEDRGPGAGTLKASTEAPSRRAVTFHRYEAGDFALHLDESVPVPEEIDISLRRWPRRRLAARASADVSEGVGLRWNDG